MEVMFQAVYNLFRKGYSKEDIVNEYKQKRK